MGLSALAYYFTPSRPEIDYVLFIYILFPVGQSLGNTLKMMHSAHNAEILCSMGQSPSNPPMMHSAPTAEYCFQWANRRALHRKCPTTINHQRVKCQKTRSTPQRDKVNNGPIAAQHADNAFCPQCGKLFEGSIGRQNPNNAFCPQCGKVINELIARQNALLAFCRANDQLITLPHWGQNE